MRGRVVPSLLSSLLVLCFVTPASAVERTVGVDDAVNRDGDGQYIVVLDRGADTTAVIERAAERAGVSVDRTYRRAISGFAATLDTEQRLGLLEDPSVAAIVP